LPARTLQFAPLGFDVSIQEMFSTWCSGGSLYLIRNELRQDGSSLLRYIDQQSIERIFLPFVALEHLAEIAVNEDGIPQCLREIVTAGNSCDSLSRSDIFRRLEHCRLHNQYGPTESHVVTEYTVNPPFQQEFDLPPISRQ
jgi:non-ribosomal peptide synthetase component F